MPTRTGLTAALACLALVAATGCGGDDESGGALTKAEYREQGNAICKGALREAEGIPAPTSPEDLGDYLEKVFDSVEESNDEFVELEPPEELRADHERAVKLGEELEKGTEGLVERVRDASDPQAAIQREFRKLGPLLARGEKVNARLGLDDCNKVGPPPEQPAPS